MQDPTLPEGKEFSNFYDCNTLRISALTKMVLEREKIDYKKEVRSSGATFEERYYVQAVNDNHWLENKAFALEMEILNDSILRARFEHEVAIRQIYFDNLQ